MKRRLTIKKLISGAAVAILLAIAPLAHAQNQEPQGTEVFLSFQYKGVVSVYITTYYKEGEFYLPVSELFNQLGIHHEVNQGAFSISGNYLGEKEFLFDFNNQVARAGELHTTLRQEQFLIKEIDYFIKPELFEQLLGLTFTTDFNNLTLDLQTEDKMPVVAKYERAQERKQINRDQPLYNRSAYPLQYDRNWESLDGAFLDYNLSAIYTENSRLFTFSNALGGELLGGDIQGNFFGSLSEQQTSFTTNGLRWRYVERDNDYFSSGIIGQTNTQGITNRAITGFKISNRPVEPRLLFDRYIIDGNVPPQSEVELYLNNRLIDYQEADQAGHYRFVVPLAYGSTNYSIRIYKPSGQSIERNNRIQIPFDYIPKGEVDYSISGGRLESPLVGTTKRGYVGAASVSAGLSNWLTAKVSSEYLTEYHSGIPAFTGTLNARLFSNYLVSANINSENFYRLTTSVVYSSGASWSLSYDYNPGNSQLYNIGGSKHQGRVNLFTPFNIGSVPLNFRWSTTYRQDSFTNLYRYRADLNTRLGRLNIRLGYQDQQAESISLEATSGSRITNSYTYSLPRYDDIPGLLRGMFIRGQLSYMPGLNQIEEMELQLSRDVFQTGRFQLTYGRNFIGDFNSISLNFTVDFNRVRSNTTTRFTNSRFSATQSLRGSIGYDHKADQLLLNNRQQVGQSAAAVRLFVDTNNDGVYQDSTDDIIEDPAVRLNRAGGKTRVKNGVNYITQLLPYYQYDLEINKEALSNPLLVPNLENFSIVTDPNQYKTIEVPFYLSGVISGRVDQKKDSTLQALSGLRLYLESNYEDERNREPFSKEIRTFSDGSFYAYEVPPGRYNLFIDPSQLDFLNSVAKPDTMEITVEALAEGDFIENLQFLVTPIQPSEPDTVITEQVEESNPTESYSDLADESLHYQIQLASFQTYKKAKSVAHIAAQKLGGTFSIIRNSNNGLFAIRTNPLPNRKQAVETVLSYHKNAYKSAALLILKNNDRDSIATKTKFIQIGAFDSRKRAEKFASSSSENLNNEIAVTYHKPSGLYKVYINERYPTDELRQQYLSFIKEKTSFANAYINEKGHLQIAAFEEKKKAEAFGNVFTDVLGYKTRVYNDTRKEHYNVYVDKKFTNSADIQALLTSIKQTGSAHQDAFVSTFTDTLARHEQKERAMNFTYEVQVKNVSMSAKTLLASLNLTGGVSIEQYQENQVILDHLNSWEQTLDLHQQLLKEAPTHHPIIILIEETAKN